MTTVAVGNRAETAVARYLQGVGYTIIERNYRRKYCEIDIVAGKDRVIYFVEVKYRSTDSWGSGLDYITAAKLSKMRRAAYVWTAERRWRGQYCLAAIEVSGTNFTVGDFISQL